MNDEQSSPKDANPSESAATRCVCVNAANCCSGCPCAKSCSSCGHVAHAAAPVQKDAWSMFAVGALCGLLFGVLLLMIVALDSGHDSYEDACHPRLRHSSACQMYMYHEMMQSSGMGSYEAAGNHGMHSSDSLACGMMGQMSSPAMHSPCVMMSPGIATDPSHGAAVGGMTGGMTGATTPSASLQQEAMARYAQEKSNFDKFLMDETVKFEASIKDVKDPAVRELRQKDFQAWLRDRQAEFNAAHSAKG